MSDEQKVLKNDVGDPVEIKCPKCGNTDPVLFDHLEDEPVRRSAKLVRDDGTLVFESETAQHYFEAAHKDRLECRNEVKTKKGNIAHLCMTEIEYPPGLQTDFE